MVEGERLGETTLSHHRKTYGVRVAEGLVAILPEEILGGRLEQRFEGYALDARARVKQTEEVDGRRVAQPQPERMYVSATTSVVVIRRR